MKAFKVVFFVLLAFVFGWLYYWRITTNWISGFDAIVGAFAMSFLLLMIFGLMFARQS